MTPFVLKSYQSLSKLPSLFYYHDSFFRRKRKGLTRFITRILIYLILCKPFWFPWHKQSGQPRGDGFWRSRSTPTSRYPPEDLNFGGLLNCPTHFGDKELYNDGNGIEFCNSIKDLLCTVHFSVFIYISRKLVGKMREPFVCFSLVTKFFFFLKKMRKRKKNGWAKYALTRIPLVVHQQENQIMTTANQIKRIIARKVV